MPYVDIESSKEKSGILIKPLNIDDRLDFIVAAHHETFRLTFLSDIEDEFLENELTRTRADSVSDNNSVVGAFIENEIVGHAVLETRSRKVDEQFGWIHFYYVAPQFRRHGVGLKLVSYSTEYFKALGMKEYCLRTGEHNESTIAFYLSAGFYRVPEGDETGLNGVKELMMSFDI